VKFTQEQLRNLKDLEASPVPGVKIAIIPINRGSYSEGYGSNVVWDARLYRKGQMGPRMPTAEELEGAGLSAEDAQLWADRTARATRALQAAYPAISEAQVQAFELAAGAELALPAGPGQEQVEPLEQAPE